MDNFEEVVDFFNDIMDALKDLYTDSYYNKEALLAARNEVYNVFKERYKVKEIEKQ